ncbi:MAG: rhomboid family intramembrane serine protease [Phycisphaerae bacterium]
MILLPIRTEMVANRTPLANYALLAVNCLAFGVFNLLRSESLILFRDQRLILHGDWPALYQFFTYQFLHADGWHLAGNMLFLWVFGNSVNAKMGDVAYLMFYLAAGVFAAVAFAIGGTHSLMGASGAIAGVTTAFLVLFPRSRVLVLFILFFITSFEVPALLLIGVKVILWDNIISPSLGGGGNVAFSAHLGGYLFGLVGAGVMLLVRAIPRDQFDMLALLDRWNRRRAFRAVMADPAAQRQAKFGTMARAAPPTPEAQQAEEQRMDRITELRSRIGECLQRGDGDAASTLYEELMAIDSSQCLPAREQVVVARHFYSTGRSPQAAGAFERYLNWYRSGFEADEIRLLVGIIYARDLQQYAAAEKHLAESLERLTTGSRRDQCREWLEFARNALGKPVTDA